MRTDSNQKEETIKVPQDMLIDAFAILLKEELSFEIIQVQENRSIALLAIRTDGNLSRPVRVVQNIKDLIDQYNEYRFSEQKNLNWREG